MKEEIYSLQNALPELAQLSKEEQRLFQSIWEPLAVKRKEIITAKGDTEKYLYFVAEGVQRIFSVQNEKESTLILTYAPSFGGVLDSFLLQKPSAYFYESLTPSQFLRASHAKFQKVTASIPVLDQIIQRQIHLAFSGLLERMSELQNFTSEQNLKKLLARSPHVLQLVPHKYIANYLGIDPTNFSKLLNSIKF